MPKSLNVLELFAGMRCIGRAFEERGHKVLSVDWDYRFPNIDFRRDVMQLTPEYVRKFFGGEDPDVIHMSPDCFPAGTLVWTNRGYKNIEDIQCFDRVLTHTGDYQRVYATQKTNKRDMYMMNVSGCEPVLVSSEHPYLVRRKGRAHGRYPDGRKFARLRLDPPEWKSVKDLSTEYRVGIPVNREARIPKWEGCVYYTRNGYGITRSWVENTLSSHLGSPDFWWMVGRYFGDGHLSMVKHSVEICCAKDENDEIKPHLDMIGLPYTYREKSTTNAFYYSSKELCEFLVQFGEGAANKQITPAILDLPVELLRAFLEGYLSADGCYDTRYPTPQWRATTVSKNLAYGLQHCILKAYGVYGSLCVVENPNTEIEGRTVNARKQYVIGFTESYNETRSQYVIEDGVAWVNIRDVEKLPAFQTTVYNLSVETDESYTANNIIVHNCTTYSLAAISHHRRKSEMGNLDPVSDYARTCDKVNMHCHNLIMCLRPKVFYIENPRGGMCNMDFMSGLPRYTVTYCSYGDKRQKPTDIWTNHPDPKFKPPCNAGDPCHEAAPRGSKTGTQGLKDHVERSLIPEDLCRHIVDISEELFEQ